MHLLTRLTRPHRLAMLVILLVHAALSAFYSFNTPLWEAHDETGHYAYARYIAVHNALPPPGAKLALSDESHQPPLYYWLVSLLVRWVDTSDDAQPRYAVLGNVYAVPDDRLDAFPYRGTALAIRLGRMMSVLLSTLSVGLTYLTGLLLWPKNRRLALLGALLHGLWPLLLFLGGAITNDIGVAFFGSLTLYLGAYVFTRPRSANRWRAYAALAASVAGGMLSKDSGIALGLFAVALLAVLTWHDLRDRAYRRLLQLSAFAAVLVALVALGGWASDGRSLRQFTTAGTLATTAASSTLTASDPAGPASNLETTDTTQWRGLASFAPIFVDWLWRLAFNSLFGSFGWGLIYMPPLWYDIALVSSLIALLGLLLAVRKSMNRGPIVLLVLFCACVALAPLLRSIATGNLSLIVGRFMLPLLGALTLLLVRGWSALPRRINTAALSLSMAGVSLVALMSPWLVIAPVYRKPALLDAVARPAAMQVESNITFGDSIQLLGYTMPAKIWSGDYAGITLYWRALKPMDKDYGLRVESFSINGQSFQNGINTTPGGGVFPTSFWKVGDTFAETYFLKMTPPMAAPTLAQIKVTWFGEGRAADTLQAALEPACPDQQPCDPKFGSVAVGVERSAEAQPSLYHFGNQISLINASASESAQAGSALTVSVVLQSNVSDMPARTAFIHLLSSDGTRMAQIDKPPLEGIYPSTVWSAGEVVRDQYVLDLPADLPPGTYTLAMGLYDSVTVERLMATDADGVRQHNDMAQLQRVTVGP